MAKKNYFSTVFPVFHDRSSPEEAGEFAGYAALIRQYQLKVPLPEILAVISKKHRNYKKEGWLVRGLRYKPEDSLYGQLTFALKYEGVNLAILKALFDVISPEDILEIIMKEPTSSYVRRIWFLYEWLQKTQLNLPNASKGKIVPVVNPLLQYAGPSRISKRHRIENNLPGVPDFCPMIRKTRKLDTLINLRLDKKARAIIEAVQPDLLTRAAAFIFLKDSKSSFAIEGETPSHNRAERWGQAIAQAGRNLLSHSEFLRLQKIIIEDFRFIHFGYRNEGGFIGEHERATGLPIPDHISARPEDLYTLMEGLIETNNLLTASEMDAVLSAASIAFGFVFIHPFEDGNGRIHRYLIHHVLAEKKFSPTHLVFPISSIILNRIIEYKKTLESYSRPRLPFIKWRPTEKGNVEVLNETINLYRYFDATRQAEFLYECIKETVQNTLPEEVDYLRKYDEMKAFIKNYIEMSDQWIDLLIRFLNQGKGVLSGRAKRKEFAALKEKEIETIERKYADIFLKLSVR